MEEQRICNEKQSIRDSGRSLKKYGSTCNHLKRQEALIKHEILRSDTLQGISLKYGVSTEQIRRANRLFASDSLFLREHLMIPVTKESPFYPTDNHILENKITHRASIAGIPNSNRRSDFSPGSPEERKSMDDFLVKIDSSIANTKKIVQQSQENSDFVDSPTDIFTTPRLGSSRNQSSSTSSGAGSGSELNMPHAVVMTQGRKVRTSLQRLQQQQDEMFEL